VWRLDDTATCLVCGGAGNPVVALGYAQADITRKIVNVIDAGIAEQHHCFAGLWDLMWDIDVYRTVEGECKRAFKDYKYRSIMIASRRLICKMRANGALPVLIASVQLVRRACEGVTPEGAEEFLYGFHRMSWFTNPEDIEYSRCTECGKEYGGPPVTADSALNHKIDKMVSVLTADRPEFARFKGLPSEERTEMWGRVMQKCMADNTFTVAAITAAAKALP